MNELLYSTISEHDRVLNLLLQECDDSGMQVPSMEMEPHLLISKVRKQYLEYMIKLLSVNYENHQKLLGKNIYLPSAIWRCAKNIENIAAQRCMVIDLYRRNITQIIKEVKTDIKKNKLNRRLFECLQVPPLNDKKVQTDTSTFLGDTTSCRLNAKRKRKLSNNKDTVVKPQSQENITTEYHCDTNQYSIPVLINNDIIEYTQNIIKTSEGNNSMTQTITSSQCEKVDNVHRMSIESQDAGEDQVMLQLEQLFGAENEAGDDLFDSSLCHDVSVTTNQIAQNPKQVKDAHNIVSVALDSDHAAKIKSLDERLAMLESSGLLNNTSNQMNTSQRTDIESKDLNPKATKKKSLGNKWLCEAYYQKLYLFEKMDDIRDNNHRKHMRIKNKFLELFGEDSEDDAIMSPLEETEAFVLSCKERIAPWIVKLLTPCYVKGRIRGKALFKSLAKHLIRLVYQCSRYPSEFEVTSFVTDFLQSHKMIRCEADYKKFRIENIPI